MKMYFADDMEEEKEAPNNKDEFSIFNNKEDFSKINGISSKREQQKAIDFNIGLQGTPNISEANFDDLPSSSHREEHLDAAVGHDDIMINDKQEIINNYTSNNQLVSNTPN